MGKNTIKLFIAFTTMAIDLFFYINMREQTYINLIFDKYLKCEKIIFDKSSLLFVFLNNWGFDLLWSFAFALTLSCFLSRKNALFIVLVICTFIEILQLIFATFGTFDVIDLIAECIGIILAILVGIYLERKGVKK